MCSSYMGLVHSSSKGVSGRDVSSSCAGIGDYVAKTGSLIGVAVYKWLGSFFGKGTGSLLHVGSMAGFVGVYTLLP
ncbi:hypothetical protein DPMN_089451 [Dreissena polymorpha]|uniref:Uncharacterized protein n=1 Tax=Dreissena polymorpha TaxID=45954 RepID=A0A9D3YBM8_DREPO|nr:hypothetical protein DPMN_085030 [Dreissena polymorpha]KAH3847136.1 hypothetical protein DPMN_089451 [Dreissena polymorpha]